MTDRELLEFAAKAAGYWSAEFSCPADTPIGWSPLDDDGDALRLAVRRQIETGGDICAATRRAIVRAAAAIGEKT
jgi:hypothetical protein